jgi:hypothetical protein
MIRSLKDLLIEADKFMAPSEGVTKEASFRDGLSSEITSLVESCLSASEVISEGAVKTASSTVDYEYEKLAMAVNRIHAYAQAAELAKSDQFAAQALSEGYSEYQVEEALSKIAAKSLKNILPILTGSLPDASSSAAKKKLSARSLPNKDKLKDASNAVGE